MLEVTCARLAGLFHLLVGTGDSTVKRYAIGSVEKSPHIYQCTPYHIPEDYYCEDLKSSVLYCLLNLRHFENDSLLQNWRSYGEYQGIIPFVELQSRRYKVNRTFPIRDVHVKNIIGSYTRM
jgi:hypothetical protein